MNETHSFPISETETQKLNELHLANTGTIREVDRWIRENTWSATLIAVGAGVLVGCCLQPFARR